MSSERPRPATNSSTGERREAEHVAPHGVLDAERLDELLDEELDETFPASDPLPWTHRVD